MEIENLKKRDVTFSFWEANFYALLFVLPIAAILLTIFYFIWAIPRLSFQFPYWLFYLIGIIIHELIHGIFAAKFSPIGFKSVKFGFAWKSLTPYCHCSAALTVNNYRNVVAAPLIILGIIPALFGLILGLSNLFGFGLFFIIVAGGDILILWKLRHVKKDSLVKDSPDKAGCEIYDSK
jgi:hypothetical protein